MTDKFKGWYPDYIENEKEREPILKLAKMMTGRAKKKLGLEKMTKYDPEYWGLALLCTDEQAEIALKMGVRQPKTLDQILCCKLSFFSCECGGSYLPVQRDPQE